MPATPRHAFLPNHDARAPISWSVVGKAAVAATVCAALSACGGGGPSSNTPISSVPPPTPPPPPAPPPPPPPPPPSPPTGDFNTAEFRRSDGPEFHGVVEAWRQNFTGSGEIIAVVDTGADSDSPEFEGRLHPLSQDVAGNRGVDPEDDHGTNVALIAAAARDGTGVVGIAFDAQLLALRADSIGSCGTDTPDDPTLGCSFDDSNIAAGIQVAIDAGATVINLSLGGSAASRSVVDAVGRAASVGIVVIVAAGNGGDGSEAGIDPDQPDPFAASILDAGNGNVIIVGSVDDQREISDFSNRAGNDAAFYLSALGERVCCVYDDGELFVENVDGQQFVTVFSGTSFAAPQVSGAVALLAQAFPNLTAQQIVEILLNTARDAGAPGTDAVFGTGILDIAAAIAPSGTTTVAGTDNALALADNFALGSAAMGDALSGASINTVVLDEYSRAYTAALGNQTQNAAQVQRLRGAVQQGGFTRRAGGNGLSLAVTVGESDRAAGLAWSNELQLTPEEALGARVLAARVAAKIAPDLQLGFAISQGSNGLVAQLQGADRPAFAIAPRAGADAGFLATSDVSFAARRELGQWGLTLSAESGRAWLGDNRRASDVVFGVRERRPTQSAGLAADRDFGDLAINTALTWLSEDSTLLGGHFNAALGLRGANTVFADADAAWRFAPNWRFGASGRAGLTRPRGGELLGGGSQLLSNAWSLDVTRNRAFSASDTVGFRISQPLRVSGGGLNLVLPVAYDYATEAPIIGRQTLSLSPEGRELMGEFTWGSPLFIGYARASVFYRHEPGHFSSAPSDMGALVSFNASF
ncbi:peptidase S8 [Erythrobacter insulae]|uniref:Peptidase S8 n=1 Tax=Erythrobacter insulae TaxID=2584124 RepID=A0A547PCL5_9SPHN|nr:S8 family peptidase [Erythrobacter insulae]TRD11879.1 peptidase S8 [Erythrobacter insulae]